MRGGLHVSTTDAAILNRRRFALGRRLDPSKWDPPRYSELRGHPPLPETVDPTSHYQETYRARCQANQLRILEASSVLNRASVAAIPQTASAVRPGRNM